MGKVWRRAAALSFELKITLVYAMVALALLGSLAMFGLWVAAKQDRAADAYTRNAVHAALLAREKNFASWVKGYALWDEIHQRMVSDTDRRWADANIGPGVWKTFTMPMTGVFVTDRRGGVAYRYWSKGTAPTLAAFRVDLAALRTRADASIEPVVVRVVHDGRPFFLGLARIRPMTAALDRPGVAPRYLVLLQPVSPLLADVAEAMAIDGLRWLPDGPVAGTSDIRLFPSRGVIGWMPRLPGTAMLRHAREPALALLIITLLAGTAQLLLARRLERLLAEQRAQAASEAENSRLAGRRAEATEAEARDLMARLTAQEGEVGRLSAEREAERARRDELARAQSLATLARFEQDFETVLEPVSELAALLDMQSDELRREAKAGRSAAMTVLAAAQESVVAIETLIEGNRELGTATTGLDAEIDRAVRSTRQVEGRMQELIDRLGELSANGAAVDGIVATVDGLAKRINMLALNARIEAARAGEAGHGFAVVADEVKQLALLTQNATASITEVIQTMQADAQTARHGIAEIRPVIGEVVELTGLSRAALERQSAVAGRIAAAIERARARVVHTDAAMRNLDAVLSTSERLGTTLGDAADDLSTRSGQLQASAVQFAGDLRNAGGVGHG